MMNETPTDAGFDEVISFNLPHLLELEKERSLNLQLKDGRIYAVHLPPESKPGDTIKARPSLDGRNLVLLNEELGINDENQFTRYNTGGVIGDLVPNPQAGVVIVGASNCKKTQSLGDQITQNLSEVAEKFVHKMAEITERTQQAAKDFDEQHKVSETAHGIGETLNETAKSIGETFEHAANDVAEKLSEATEQIKKKAKHSYSETEPEKPETKLG